MIVLPAMPPEQTASWLGVLDLYDHHSQSRGEPLLHHLHHPDARRP